MASRTADVGRGSGEAPHSGAISRRRLIRLGGAAAAAVVGRGAWAQSRGRAELVMLTATLGAENWLTPFTGLPELGLLEPMFESLLFRDYATGLVVEREGRLAQTWDRSPDAKTFRFQIRRGVPFHDGGELTAEDVAYSFELAMMPDAKNPAASYFRSQIASVTVDNPYALTLNMRQASPGLPFRLTEMLINFGITSKRYVTSVGPDQARRRPVGTGPYKFSESRPGEFLRFAAVANHWRKTPSIGTLTVRAVPDDAARLNMLRAGEGDLAAIGFDDVPVLEQARRKVDRVRNMINCGIQLQGQYLRRNYPESQTPPWAQSDARKALAVRRALSLTIDRAAIVENVLHGFGTPNGAAVAGFFPANKGYPESAQADAFQPDRARALLREAGYAEPAQVRFTVDLVVQPTRPWNALLMEAVAQQWSNFGFDVTMQRSDYAAFVDRTISRRAVEAWCYPPAYFDDAAELLSFYTRSTDRLSYTGESEALDRLMAESLGAVSDAEIQQTRSALFAYLSENIPSLSVCYADQLYGLNPSLAWPRPPTAFTTAYFENARYE
jgi:peptide/nickel transport system substrate-binding protein